MSECLDKFYCFVQLVDRFDAQAVVLSEHTDAGDRHGTNGNADETT